MKKLLTSLLVLLFPFIFTLSFNLPVQASEKQALSPYVNKIEDVIVREQLEGSLILEKQIVETLQYGDLSSNIWLEQTVQCVSMPVANDAIKVVTWSKGSADSWKSATVTTTAADFEAKNPGWMVVAAVNGDFFDIGNTFQPTNTFVQNGDVLKRDVVGAPYGVLGFRDDNTYVVGHPTSTNDMYLSLYEGNEVIEKYTLQGVNISPVESGVTLLTTSLASTVDLTGFDVYVGSYELNRVTPTGHFVKGTITRVVDDMSTLNKVPTGEFYLVSKDVTLPLETKVKCEYELTGIFAGVKNTMGFNHQVLNQGNVLHQGVTKNDDAFIGTAHPRTLIGFKEDGGIILMVVDGRHPGEKRNGVSLFEAGELLRLKGAVNGYNLDGGGSSTLVVRDEKGDFKIINSPSDGGERSIGNAVLLVMQDPRIEITEITHSTMTFEQMGPIVEGTIEDIMVKVGGKTYPFVDGKVTVTNLIKSTSYDVTYYYTIRKDDGSTESCISRTYKISTTYIMPEIDEFKVKSKNDTSVTFEYEYDDRDHQVNQAYLSCGTDIYEITDESGSIQIDDLNKGETYDFQLVLVLKDGTRIKSDVLSVKTEVAKSGGCNFGFAYLLSFIVSLSLLVMITRQRK